MDRLGLLGSHAGRRLALALATALLCLAAPSPTPAAATFAGENGRIYFQGPESGTSGPADVFGVDPGGSNLLDLTPGSGASEERPSVSPDAQRVAFQTYRDGGWNIFAVGVDGSGATNLTKTTEPVVNFEPAWSPNGSTIVFMRQNPGQDLWAMNANGSGQVDLTSSEGEFEAQPEFSPDGTKVAYISAGVSGSNNDIWVMNADGFNRTQLTFDEAPVQNLSPTWSPDGSQIAFERIETTGASDNGIHVMPSAGGGAVRLLDGPNPILGDHLAWSPDGGKIAYQRSGGGISIVNADGSSPTPLTGSGPDYPSWATVPSACACIEPESPISRPSNRFRFGKLKLNRKKGTASLVVAVPGPGLLVLSGKGVRKVKRHPKRAGKVTLPVKASGRKLKRLGRDGRLKLILKVAFTPSGGSVATRNRELVLKKAG